MDIPGKQCNECANVDGCEIKKDADKAIELLEASAGHSARHILFIICMGDLQKGLSVLGAVCTALLNEGRLLPLHQITGIVTGFLRDKRPDLSGPVADLLETVYGNTAVTLMEAMDAKLKAFHHALHVEGEYQGMLSDILDDEEDDAQPAQGVGIDLRNMPPVGGVQ